jgi:putative MFS transporter
VADRHRAGALFGSIFHPESPLGVWSGIWLLICAGALVVCSSVSRCRIAALPRDARPRRRRHRSSSASASPDRRAAQHRRRQRHQSDPFAVVFKMFPLRVVAGMICFTAFFGFAIGLGAWLPNIMYDKGFTITKSLQYVLAMNFAVPCASIFMMYALDNIGRKLTSVCAFIAAGVMAGAVSAG